MLDTAIVVLGGGLAFISLCLLGLLALIYMSAETVLGHAASTPGAAKALFEHVFVPVFVGELPGEPAPQSPPDSEPDADPLAAD